MTKKKQKLTLHKQPVSPTTVWLAVIASTLVAILLYVGLAWLDNQDPNTAMEVSSTQPELGLSDGSIVLLVLIVGALVLGPGILVALIVLPMIRKNKKK